MIALLCFVLTLLASLFKSKSRLEAENAALRRQLIVLRRKVRGRVQLTNGDRLFLVPLYRWFPSVLKAITIIRPETLVRWHRAGFRRYWRWKSRLLGGRPKIAADLRALIRRMPDLFREGQGMIAEGALDPGGTFRADSVLAKYDETYVPKDVADALKKRGHSKDDYEKKLGAAPQGNAQ
jgi:hypothetical protein